MKQFFKSFYLTKRFFIAIFSIAILFVVAYFFGNVFWIIKLLFLSFSGTCYNRCTAALSTIKRGFGERQLPEKLSNGDENPIEIRLVNRFQFKVSLKLLTNCPCSGNNAILRFRFWALPKKKIHL